METDQLGRLRDVLDAAKRSAMSLPMPRPAPVMMAVLFFNFMDVGDVKGWGGQRLVAVEVAEMIGAKKEVMEFLRSSAVRLAVSASQPFPARTTTSCRLGTTKM